MPREIIIEHPPQAVEIGAAALATARRGESGAVEVGGSRALPADAVRPSLTEDNLPEAGLLATALAESLHALGNPRECVAVVPDAAVRVTLLDFDQLPAKRAEADQLVLARLRKSLPFDADDAAFSYASTVDNGRTQVVAAVILRSVLEGYEAAFRAAGCEPGVVLPSTLAALGALEAEGATLLLKLDETTTSVAIVSQNQLRLFRTHEGGRSLSAAQIAADIFPSLVYFKDNFGERLQRIVYCGPTFDGELRALLEQQTGARVEIFGRASGLERLPADAAGAVGALSGLSLAINLASKPYRDVKRYLLRATPWLAALLALTLALTIFTVHRRLLSAESARQIQQLQAQISEQDRLRSHAEQVLGDDAQQAMLANSRIFNDAINRKRFSWTTFFMRMERLLPERVRLSAVRPHLSDNGDIDLEITAEALNRAPIVELMQRMEGSDYFTQVRLENEGLSVQENAEGGDYRSIRQQGPESYHYSLRAIYLPNGKGGQR